VNEAEAEAEEEEPLASSHISDQLSGTDPAIPWFLQTETIDAPIDQQSGSSTVTQLEVEAT